MSLDRTRDFGTVFGLPGRVRFEQDEKYFDASGEEISPPSEVPTPVTPVVDYESMSMHELQNMLLNRATARYPNRRSLPSNRDGVIAALQALDG